MFSNLRLCYIVNPKEVWANLHKAINQNHHLRDHNIISVDYYYRANRLDPIKNAYNIKILTL